MIKNLTLQNVRIFDGGSWSIRTPKLTVFCGTNSAGKSTVLKTLLLLRQSQGIQEGSITKNGTLRFAGTQVDVGDFTSFVSHNDIAKEIGISITVNGKAPAEWMKLLSLCASADNPAVLSNTLTDQNEYQFTASLSFAGTPGRQRGTSTEPQRCRYSGTLSNALYTIQTDRTHPLKWLARRRTNTTESNDRYDIHIPESYFKNMGGSHMMEGGASDDNGNVIFGTRLNGLMPESIVARLKIRDTKTKREAWNLWPMPPHISDAQNALTKALTRLHYLGPLRSPGRRFYLTQLDDRPSWDATGESLPSILRDRLGDSIWNCSPFDSAKVSQISLGEALDIWLRYFRTGEYSDIRGHLSEVDLTVTSDVLVEVRIKSSTNSEFHALTDSGFGYSQVIPIIIRGLLAEQDSTILIEQPELHLNPSLQVRLAHFFAMIQCGKQVIVETHSEHIVNTIRVLCAEDPTHTLHQECSIQYLSTKDGKVLLKELSIHPNGMIPQWPKEFFGEASALAGRLLRAQKLFISASQNSP